MSETALADLRIIEFAQGVAAPYCAKLLGDLGADVVKAEPPDGDRSRRTGPFPGDVPDPERSGQYLYLNTNKRSVALDPASGEGRALLLELIGGADLLVVDKTASQLEALDLGYEQLASINPRLIVTCVTPFGGVGPYSGYAGTAFTTYHAGGLGWGTPHNEVTDPPNQPPLAPGGYLAEYVTGVTAAAATMVAVTHRRAYGVGQLVDVAGMESIANAIRGTLASVTTSPDMIPPRRKQGFPWVWPCQDGHVSISFITDHWWSTLREMMGDPEWARSELFDERDARQDNADVLEPLIIEWLMQTSKDDIHREALARDLPGFPVRSIAELVGSRQFAERAYLAEVEQPGVGRLTMPGAPAKFSRTPFRIARPAPRLGAHTGEVRAELEQARGAGEAAPAAAAAGNRPLEGIRIADFGWILSVPHATAWLGTLGAEVIRIESQANLDLMRTTGLTRGTDGVPGLNRAGGYNALNFGKKSITLNLKEPRAIELAKELVRRSDAVTENFVVGTMERFGLGYEELRAVKPDIVMLSGSTGGQTGPERAGTGWGPNAMAVGGAPYLTGYAGGPPSSLDSTFPDFVIGVQMAYSLLAALHERARTGQGQYIDLSMAETVVAMIPEAVLDHSMNGRDAERIGNRHPALAPHGVYPCRGDDSWVAVAVAGDEQWRGLCAALGEQGWAADERYGSAAGRRAHQDQLDDAICEWTRQRTNYEAMHALQAHGVAATAVLGAMALFEDPQLKALGYFVDIDHPEVGVRRVPGLPARYSAMPQLAYSHAPLLGEHNEDILCGLLGLSRARYDQLVAEQVIY